MSSELPDALLRRRKAYEHVRIQYEPPALTTVGASARRRVRVYFRFRAALDVPSGRDIDRHDRQAGARDERERSVKRGAHGGLEREAKDSVENDVIRCERRRQRRLRVGPTGTGERRDVHVFALRVQALRNRRTEQTRQQRRVS